MIVDDEWAIAEAIADVLEGEGLAIIVASNGAEALRMLVGRLPAGIIADIMMPVMDGITFVDNLRGDSALKHVPVLLMSAALPSSLPDLRGCALLSKPFTTDELLRAVDANFTLAPQKQRAKSTA